MIVEGQIHRGLTDGVGMALMELIAFDEEGNCLGGSLMDYLIPTAIEVPDWETDETVTPVAAPPDRRQGRRRVGDGRLAADDRQRDLRRARSARGSPRRHAVHAVAGVGGDAGGVPAMTPRFVSGLVLAAGGSSRLGRPKQLLRYGSGTLLGHVLDTARDCAFDQLLCVVGGQRRGGAQRRRFHRRRSWSRTPSSARAARRRSPSALGRARSARRRARADARRSARRHGRTPSPRWSPASAMRRSRPARTPMGADIRSRSRGRCSPSSRRCTATRRCGSCSTGGPRVSSTCRFPGPIPRDVDTWEDYERVLGAGRPRRHDQLSDRVGREADARPRPASGATTIGQRVEIQSATGASDWPARSPSRPQATTIATRGRM